MVKYTSEQTMIVVPVEYTSSSEFHLPPESNVIGKKAVERMINFVPGITLVSTREYGHEPEITSVANPRKVPGTPEYKQEQNRISTIARSEWAASNAHRREQ